jgi:hypothetical protein
MIYFGPCSTEIELTVSHLQVTHTVPFTVHLDRYSFDVQIAVCIENASGLVCCATNKEERGLCFVRQRRRWHVLLSLLFFGQRGEEEEEERRLNDSN